MGRDEGVRDHARRMVVEIIVLCLFGILHLCLANAKGISPGG